MALFLSRHDDGDMLVICAVGDLESSTVSAFEEEIASTMAIDVSGVVVDLSGVAFLDSAGINALLKGRRVAEEHGRVFRVEKPAGLVQEVLVMTGVWPLLSGTP